MSLVLGALLPSNDGPKGRLDEAHLSSRLVSSSEGLCTDFKSSFALAPKLKKFLRASLKLILLAPPANAGLAA